MVKSMVKGSTFMQMEMYIKVIGPMILSMEKAFMNIIYKVNHMMVNGIKGNVKEEVVIHILWEINMMVNGRRVKKVEEESLNLLQELVTMGNGLRIGRMVVE